jgi:hypothetical protein
MEGIGNGHTKGGGKLNEDVREREGHTRRPFVGEEDTSVRHSPRAKTTTTTIYNENKKRIQGDRIKHYAMHCNALSIEYRIPRITNAQR